MLTRTNAIWNGSKNSHFINTSMVNVELLYMKGPESLGQLFSYVAPWAWAEIGS